MRTALTGQDVQFVADEQLIQVPSQLVHIPERLNWLGPQQSPELSVLGPTQDVQAVGPVQAEQVAGQLVHVPERLNWLGPQQSPELNVLGPTQDVQAVGPVQAEQVAGQLVHTNPVKYSVDRQAAMHVLDVVNKWVIGVHAMHTRWFSLQFSQFDEHMLTFPLERFFPWPDPMLFPKTQVFVFVSNQ